MVARILCFPVGGVRWLASCGRDFSMSFGKTKSDHALNAIWIVIVLGILMLGMVCAPSIVRSRTTGAANACINVLRQLEGAKSQWQLEHNKTTNDIPTWEDVKPYLGRGADSFGVLFCPADPNRACTNAYELGDLRTPAHCK